MKNCYKFCSICGLKLKPEKGNLVCVKCPFVNYRNPRPTVTALIVYKNKLLLNRRNDRPFKGWWDLLGGFIDKGEAPERAVERELKEETGLFLKKKKFFGIYTGTYPHRFDPAYILSMVYIVEPKSGVAKIRDENEIAGLRWFSKKELPKQIAFDSNRRALKDFLKVWN